MELKSLYCPRCGAVIEAEDGLDTFFCKYCGNKIILSGQSDAAYDAKVRMQENKLKYEIEKENHKFDKILGFLQKNPELIGAIILFTLFVVFSIVVLLIV